MIKPFKGRTLERGQVVQVYRNLNNGVFSIRDKKTGLVVAHGNHIHLNDCSAVISLPGQLKARRSLIRNVHAWIEGTYLGALDLSGVYLFIPEPQELYYNPFKTDTFIDKRTGKPPESLERVYFYDEKAYIH